MKTAFSLVALLICAIAAGPVLAEPPRKPNIIFVLADDLGIDGVSCCGADAYAQDAAHNDAFAQSGLRFQTCYAAARCAVLLALAC